MKHKFVHKHWCANEGKFAKHTKGMCSTGCQCDPPPFSLSECLFFFGVFLSMLARAAGP